MKKLLKILVLVFLFSTSAIAKTIKLDQGIKINIPKNYEYLQFDQQDFVRANFKGVISESEIEDLLNEQVSLLGFDGTETSTIIAKKGYAKGFGSYYNHVINGKDPQSWSGMKKIQSKCGKKKSQESQLKCIIKLMKLDPIFQIDIANSNNENIKQLALDIKMLEHSSKKEIDDVNETSEKIRNSFGKIYKNELNLKITKINDKKWGFEIIGEDDILGMKAKRIGYLIIHKEKVFTLQGFCMTQATCKKIKKLNNEIIEPYFSINTKVQKTTSNISDSGDLAEQLKVLNELYKSGALTKEEFARAKNKLLN
tara:strand:+ start:39 stop:971 length:933 start_codon:yes stop_codon:yes gene_type:complete